MRADFHHDVSSERLLVDRAWTGKHLTSARIRHHSKGRAGMSHYRTSMLNVRVREMTPDELEKHARAAPMLPTAERIAKLSRRGY